MPPSQFKSLFLALTALRLLPTVANASDALQGLINRSPFGNVEMKPVAADSAEQPLEFRAILEEHGRKVFSIYESGTRRSAWVDMNDLGHGFSVKAYNDEQPSIVVEYQGRLLTLALKRAPIAVRATPQNPGGAVQSPILTATNSPQIDPVRLKAVEKELQRRYAENRNGYTSPAKDPTATGHP